MQYFMKLYPCVDKDIEHEVFLKSTEKSFKEKKSMCYHYWYYTFTMYYFCLDFKEVCHYIFFPPMILWNSQKHKLGNKGFENHRPRDRDETRMNVFCPVHFLQY